MGGCVAWLDAMLIQGINAVGIGGTLNNPQYLRDRRLRNQSTYTRVGGSGFMTLQATLTGWTQGVQLAALWNVTHLGGAPITCYLKNATGTVTYASKTFPTLPIGNGGSNVHLIALFDQWYPAQRVEWQWTVAGNTTLFIGRMWASPCIFRRRGLQVGWGNQLQDTSVVQRMPCGVVNTDVNNTHRVITGIIPDLTLAEAWGESVDRPQSIYDLGQQFGNTAEVAIVPTSADPTVASINSVLGTMQRSVRIAHNKGNQYRTEIQVMENR